LADFNGLAVNRQLTNGWAENSETRHKDTHDAIGILESRRRIFALNVLAGEASDGSQT
jgi:hypothetical protein